MLIDDDDDNDYDGKNIMQTLVIGFHIFEGPQHNFLRLLIFFVLLVLTTLKQLLWYVKS